MGKSRQKKALQRLPALPSQQGVLLTVRLSLDDGCSAEVMIERQLYFFELLLNLQTIQHPLICGPQLRKVLFRRDQDQIK